MKTNEIIEQNGLELTALIRKENRMNCNYCINKNTRDCPYWQNENARISDFLAMPEPPTCYRPENKNENI